LNEYFSKEYYEVFIHALRTRWLCPSLFNTD
jgi:hypothetical protein